MSMSQIRRSFAPLGAVTALLLIASFTLGDSGTTNGDPSTGESIANVTFPPAVLGLLLLVALAVWYRVALRRSEA